MQSYRDKGDEGDGRDERGPIFASMDVGLAGVDHLGHEVDRGDEGGRVGAVEVDCEGAVELARAGDVEQADPVLVAVRQVGDLHGNHGGGRVGRVKGCRRRRGPWWCIVWRSGEWAATPEQLIDHQVAKTEQIGGEVHAGVQV